MSMASFLGLETKIKDGRFQIGLFDKRESFPFSNAWQVK